MLKKHTTKATKLERNYEHVHSFNLLLCTNDWNKDILTDDFDEIDHKVEHFTMRIAKLQKKLDAMMVSQVSFLVLLHPNQLPKIAMDTLPSYRIHNM
jgi:hypothetical protein